MSIPIVDHISCYNCSYPHIGKVENWLFLSKIRDIEVYEVTCQWICLYCEKIQIERIEIREIRENEIIFSLI